MDKGIFVEYKGGISKIVDTDEDWFEFESNISLTSLLLKICKVYERKLKNNDSFLRHSVLLMLNGSFVPSADFEKIMLKEADRVTLFPAVSGG